METNIQRIHIGKNNAVSITRPIFPKYKDPFTFDSEIITFDSTTRTFDEILFPIFDKDFSFDNEEITFDSIYRTFDETI